MSNRPEGPEAWADLTARIYADRDFSPGGREAALALAWALHHPPAEGEKGGTWSRARRALGADSVYHSTPRIAEAAAQDLPWYDPRLKHWNQLSGSCEGPRMRPYRPREHGPHRVTIADFLPPQYGDPGVCGAHATTCVTEYDPVTGWETPHWFCSRHRDRARDVERQLRAAVPDPPPPIPNRGGVLPRYFSADWAKLYGWVAETAHGHYGTLGWKPPYHGVCRDDWPVPGKTTVPKRPRLSIVVS